MNAFANTLFTLLLGWVKSLAQALWGLVSGGGANGFFVWLGDNWLVIAAVLCLGGVAVDVVVWLLRWRPDLVWRTKWRRLAARLSGREMGDREARHFYQGYQDGVDMQQDGLYPEGENWEPVPAPAPEPAWWEMQEPSPVYEDAPAAEAAYAPLAQDAPQPRRRRSDKYQKNNRQNPIGRIREKLMEPQDDENVMLDGLPPIVDKEQAFYAPVFPKQENTDQ